MVQPLLGRAADVYGYPASLAISGVIELIAVPFLLASRRQRSFADQANTSIAASDPVPRQELT